MLKLLVISLALLGAADLARCIYRAYRKPVRHSRMPKTAQKRPDDAYHGF